MVDITDATKMFFCFFFCKMPVIKAYIIHLNGAVIQDVVCFMGSLFDLESSSFFRRQSCGTDSVKLAVLKCFSPLKYSTTCLHKLNTFMHFSRSKDIGTIQRVCPDLGQV